MWTDYYTFYCGAHIGFPWLLFLANQTRVMMKQAESTTFNFISLLTNKKKAKREVVLSAQDSENIIFFLSFAFQQPSTQSHLFASHLPSKGAQHLPCRLLNKVFSFPSLSFVAIIST